MSDKPARVKNELRSQVRARRDSMDSAERLAESQRVTRRLLQSGLLADVSTVMAYRASEHELSVDGAVEELRAGGARVVFPRVAGKRMLSIHEPAADQFTEGAFGILEPIAEACEIDVSEVDAVLVPGIAFDRRGFRLGYGGGFYDALLARLREDCLTIGVCFDQQLFDIIPTEPHDLPVRLVVTPSDFLDPRQR